MKAVAAAVGGTSFSVHMSTLRSGMVKSVFSRRMSPLSRSFRTNSSVTPATPRPMPARVTSSCREESSISGVRVTPAFRNSCSRNTRELAFRSVGETDAHLFDLGAVGEDRLWKELSGLIRAIQENHFTPICLKKDGKMADFTYCPIAQYGPAMETVRYDTFSTLMDDFYALREQQERVRQRGADLLRTATTARDRIRRKLAMQEKDYAATQNRDQLRIYGDLITANLYRMERGAARLETENFYDPECRPVALPLDPLLTPQQNAAKYYKRYTQAKTAEKYLAEQMALARRDLDYLESVLEELSRAETEQDFLDIRGELRDAGFLRRQ